jgi:Mg/Co/Ni transporter MgtE
MSPRAASRLEAIGFEQVYDYVAGKADWGASGLPLEGRPGFRAGELARADTPTCTLAERLQDVCTRVREGGWNTCLVVDERRVVLGRLGRKALARTDAVVEEAMSAGPRTFRPDVRLGAVVGWMRRRNLTSAVVTTSDGRLVGVVLRDEAEARLAGEREAAGAAQADTLSA